MALASNMFIQYTTDGPFFDPVSFLNQSAFHIIRAHTYTTHIDVQLLGCDYGYYDTGGIHCVECVCRNYDSYRDESFV